MSKSGGVFQIFLRSDDVTWTMYPVSAPGPPPFKNPGSAPESGCFQYRVSQIEEVRGTYASGEANTIT